MTGLTGGGRRRSLALVVAVVVGMGVGGMVAVSFVKSPVEAAAEAEPPGPTVLTAEVERRVLADTVVVRGTVVAGQTFELTAPGQGGGVPVVTAIRVQVGDELDAGAVAAEVSGRPIIVLPGAVPAYRDLRPGADGPDIAQLQAALEELGYSVGSDGAEVFGPGTAAAVDALYESLGYDAPTTGDEEQVDAAGDAVKAARRALEEAERARGLAVEGADAADDIADNAEAEAGKRRRAAVDAATAAEVAVSAAKADADDPELAQAAAEAQWAADQVAAAAEAAEADAAAKRAAATRAPGEPDPVEEAGRQVAMAREDLAAAQEAYAEVTTGSGPTVPLGEYVFVPTLPARVQSLAASVGDDVVGPIASLSTGQLVVSSRVDVGLRGLLAETLPADVLSELSGLEAAAVITEIGPAGESDAGGFGHTVVITPRDPLPPEAEGADVRVTVEAATTDGPVLVVPIAAVTSAADGSTIVVTINDVGEQARIDVIAGLSADGFVAVEPVRDGALQAGDLVVTGS